MKLLKQHAPKISLAQNIKKMLYKKKIFATRELSEVKKSNKNSENDNNLIKETERLTKSLRHEINNHNLKDSIENDINFLYHQT